MGSASPLPGTPEERIIHEIYLANKGGTPPDKHPAEYHRIFESVLLRELHGVAREIHSRTRFARGFVVGDYARDTQKGILITDIHPVVASGPRFDVVCYSGNVAWNTHEGIPHALVPASRALGVVDVKRTLAPEFFDEDSPRSFNTDYREQQNVLDSVGAEVPLIALAAHYRGTKEEIRNLADVDHVALLGDLDRADPSSPDSAERMAEMGELLELVRLVSDRRR